MSEQGPPQDVPPGQQNYQPIEGQQQQSSSCAGNAIQGIQAAHSDFVQWFYKPHGSVMENLLGQADQNGMKREMLGYGMIGLTVLLLCTAMAPLVANLICIVYPCLATVALLRGQSQDVQRWSIYWVIFGLFSLGDYYCGISTTYWFVKIVVCLFLYLPQTQGAVCVYNTVISPTFDFLEAKLA